jgi:hypothetical protein
LVGVSEEEKEVGFSSLLCGDKPSFTMLPVKTMWEHVLLPS